MKTNGQMKNKENSRQITIVVDNDSWILYFAEQLVNDINKGHDNAIISRHYEEIPVGDIAFYFGCIKITPPEVLARNKKNLVVHASDLPKGRGFSPLTWQILEGAKSIPICLISASENVDQGPIIYRDIINLNGDEILSDLHDLVGGIHIKMAKSYLSEQVEPIPQEQVGEPSYYRRRYPEDSRLNPNKTIAEQFNLFRTVDNDKYPAFFDFSGARFLLKIEKVSPKITS